MKQSALKTTKTRPLRTTLRIAVAVTLLAFPWAVASVQAAEPRSSSGSSRPVAPNNNPAGAGTRAETPGASTGASVQRPGTPGTGATPSMTPVPQGSPAPGTPAQGTVEGSKGAPGAQGDLPGGSAGSRGQKDSRRGH
ncbi:hypothetical protein [Bordetella flabilis]|uniref:Uncharacterized protein n=1 Tax=Bordetella flabilis TaxID=463014 RepID=A0A193GI10_9BORD|nr:hypothetical protein [Bordetella flabilis]ANN79228.1 hypothetical protein BAU07_20785 [Bordetella flabilis]